MKFVFAVRVGEWRREVEIPVWQVAILALALLVLAILALPPYYVLAGTSLIGAVLVMAFDGEEE